MTTHDFMPARDVPFATASTTPASRLAQFVRAHVLDVGLALVAVAFASPSIVYPFGRDQGVHFYVGRAWLHGGMPYRDAFDYKPPGIFALHAALIAAFGEEQWPVRIADVACVLAMGVACWALLSARPRGALGLTCLATSLAYFGFFSFWDTAQCELWCTTFSIIAIVAAKGGRPLRSGLLVGAAFIMKPQALLFAAVAALVLIRRRPASVTRSLLRFAIGAAALPGVTTLYFAARGGLGAMKEALGGATWAYVVGARGVDSAASLLRESVTLFSWFNPYATVILVAGGLSALLAKAEGDPRTTRRYRLAFVLGVAAYLGVATQMKFYRYHWALLVPALVLALGETVLWVSERLSAQAGRAATACLFAVFPLAGEPARTWWTGLDVLVQSAGGAPRRAMLARFSMPALGYDPIEIKDTGDWLRARTTATDRVLVRGFLPEVYVIARRSAPGRFFWSTPLTDTRRAYRADEWRAEDRESVSRLPPVFVVVLAGVHAGPDSAEYYRDSGYLPETQIGRLMILKRAPPP
jgi:Dolichyl-phosphate-mannose-protein mannosyltransferase